MTTSAESIKPASESRPPRRFFLIAFTLFASYCLAANVAIFLHELGHAVGRDTIGPPTGNSPQPPVSAGRPLAGVAGEPRWATAGLVYALGLLFMAAEVQFFSYDYEAAAAAQSIGRDAAR